MRVIRTASRTNRADAKRDFEILKSPTAGEISFARNLAGAMDPASGSSDDFFASAPPSLAICLLNRSLIEPNAAGLFELVDQFI